MAIAIGARAIGLVAQMPSGPGPISDEAIRDIAAHVHARHGDSVWTTLLTSRTQGAAIADHVAETGVNTVQIVDAPEVNAYDLIRAAHSALRIIQVVHVEDESAIDNARLVSQSADVILLDSGKPNVPVKVLGGTGNTHDWAISKRIVEAVKAPVFLAGGLNPMNAASAVSSVSPYGLDVCSGLRDRENGYRLDPKKLDAFVAALA